MTEAYQAGKYHAISGKPSNVAFYTPRTFAWFDYLEGLESGYNDLYWSSKKDPAYLTLRDEVKAALRAAGRSK